MNKRLLCFIALCCVVLCGCAHKTSGAHYKLNPKTQEMEMTEFISMEGTNAHSIKFSNNAEAEAGGLWPSIDIELDKLLDN